MCVCQAIFMIPTNPSPTLRDPSLWSGNFVDFIAQCLVKNAESRATATQLLQVLRYLYYTTTGTAVLPKYYYRTTANQLLRTGLL